MLGRKNRMEAAEAPKLAFAWLGVRHPPKQALEVPRLWWVVFCYLVAEHDPAWNDGDGFRDVGLRMGSSMASCAGTSGSEIGGDSASPRVG
jgi:hypothetical protein